MELEFEDNFLVKEKPFKLPYADYGLSMPES